MLRWCVDYFSEETAKVQKHIYPTTAEALNRFLPVVEGGHQRSDREREKQEQEVSAPFQREIYASGAICQCSILHEGHIHRDTCI